MEIDIEKVLTGVRKASVLVVGDVMLDRYIFGTVDRVSPEAPVPVVAVRREETRLGGAGNVAANLAALGCKVKIVSVTGRGDGALMLPLLFSRSGVGHDGLLVDVRRETTVKTRVLAGDQQVVRVDLDEKEPISDGMEGLLLDYIKKVLPQVDVVLVSDYAKGVLTDRVLSEVIRLSQEIHVPVVVDPKGRDFSRYEGATLITPNAKEFKLAGEKYLSVGISAALVTQGQHGMTLLADNAETHFLAEAREVFDVSGAGDTVLACVGVGLAAGLSLHQAAELANAAAGIVVGKVGTATITADDLLRRFSDEHASKIVAFGKIRDLMANHRKRNDRIVFTNGCFDLLHAGHVRLLKEARKRGDVLVVGLNSDASVRALKGSKRPVLNQGERAQLLAALDCVDYVTIFDAITPLVLIKTVKPDVLVKGSDYANHEVVGRKFVEMNGGRVDLIALTDGVSTSGIIDEVVRRYVG